MNKNILKLIVIGLSFTQVNAKSKIFDRIKSRSSKTLLSIKMTAAYVISSVRESNAIKIQRALEAKEAVLKLSQLLNLKDHNEQALLHNIQVMGFDKHDSLSALILAERYYADMSSVVSRYNSKIARWNKSSEMESVALSVLAALSSCKEIKLYFEQHKLCLRAWEIVDSYQDLIASPKLSGMIKNFESLRGDVEKIKLCITKNSFRLAYPDTYKNLHECLPVLECKLDLVEA